MIKDALGLVTADVSADRRSSIIPERDADNNYAKVGVDRLDLVDCKLDKEFFDQLKSDLKDDDPDIKEKAK